MVLAGLDILGKVLSIGIALHSVVIHISETKSKHAMMIAILTAIQYLKSRQFHSETVRLYDMFRFLIKNGKIRYLHDYGDT